VTRERRAADGAARGALARTAVRGAADPRGDGGGVRDGAPASSDAHRGAEAADGAADRRCAARACGGGAVDRGAGGPVIGGGAASGAGARAVVSPLLLAVARALPVALVLPIGSVGARVAAGLVMAGAIGVLLPVHIMQQSMNIEDPARIIAILAVEAVVG